MVVTFVTLLWWIFRNDTVCLSCLSVTGYVTHMLLCYTKLRLCVCVCVWGGGGGGGGGYMLVSHCWSIFLSVSLWTESCLLCIFLNRFRSVSSTILTRYFTFLHILFNQLQKVSCVDLKKKKKIEVLLNFLNKLLEPLLDLDL